MDRIATTCSGQATKKPEYLSSYEESKSGVECVKSPSAFDTDLVDQSIAHEDDPSDLVGKRGQGHRLCISYVWGADDLHPCPQAYSTDGVLFKAGSAYA
jgi:hypothetical protein